MTNLKPSELTLHERTFLRLTDSIKQLADDKDRVREAIKKAGCRHIDTKELGGGLQLCCVCFEILK